MNLHIRQGLNLRTVLSSKYILLIALGVLSSLYLLLNYRFLMVFLVVAILAGILNYFLHVTNVHIHLGHVSFLAIVFSYALGFKYGVLMVVLAHFLPEILSAHADMEMVITGGMYIVISFLAATFSSINIVTLGIMLTVLHGIVTFSLGRIAGTPLTELITEDGVEFVMNIIYFTSLSHVLLVLIGLPAA
jgi:hypothetical protein